jgi:hypothetical protein
MSHPELRYRWQTLQLARKLNRGQSGEARDPRLRRLFFLEKRIEADQAPVPIFLSWQGSNKCGIDLFLNTLLCSRTGLRRTHFK